MNSSRNEAQNVQSVFTTACTQLQFSKMNNPIISEHRGRHLVSPGFLSFSWKQCRLQGVGALQNSHKMELRESGYMEAGQIQQAAQQHNRRGSSRAGQASGQGFKVFLQHPQPAAWRRKQPAKMWDESGRHQLCQQVFNRSTFSCLESKKQLISKRPPRRGWATQGLKKQAQ